MIKAFKTLKENNTSGEITTVWRQVDVKKEDVVAHKLRTRPIEELYKGSSGVKTWKAKDVVSSDTDQVTIKQEWFNGEVNQEHVHHVVYVTYSNDANHVHSISSLHKMGFLKGSILPFQERKKDKE
tara:strand:- start:1209 stop:1586 length:378 start_codon:yes stop_codon:yes gene_type:complete